MHIVFNAYITNMGNTGGCNTIVKSAQVLRTLGHKVDIVARKNRYTWQNIKTIPEIPKCDACIAVSVLDIDSTRHSKSKIKAFWMRGEETWFRVPKEIYKKTKSILTIANSSWLAEKYNCKKCFSGIDFYSGENSKTHNIGFLYNNNHKSKRTDLCINLKKFIETGYFSYGTEKYSGNDFVYKRNPSEEVKRNIYSSCGAWFAPTEHEGFHNPPAEACLAGCVVVCNKKYSNGMGDYANDDTAMRYDNYEEAIEFLKSPDFSKVAKMRKVLEDLGSKEKNMQKLINILKES